MSMTELHGRDEPSITHHLNSLHEFVGKWKLVQRVWKDSEGQPEVYHGHSHCESILGGAATLMTTEVESTRFKGVALITFNPTQQRFEMAFADAQSEQGLQFMHGASSNVRSRAALRSEYGKVATELRSWGAPGGAEAFALNASPAAACVQKAFSEVEQLSEAGGFRMVENRISADHFVLDFTIGGTLVQQNEFIREE